MSSILDALEKAHRKRRKAGTGLAPEEMAEAERRERQIHDESVRHRRMFFLLVAGVGFLALLLLFSVSALIYVAITSNSARPAEPSPQVAVAPAPVSVETPLPTPQPTPQEPEEATAQAPEEADPTASPEQTPEQTPLPTPEVTATPEPTATPTPEATPTPQPPRFAHMQVVYDVELDIKIRGVIADGPSSVIMIDDAMVPLGRRHGRVRPIRIENRMIEAEYDQDGEEITVFIRW